MFHENILHLSNCCWGIWLAFIKVNFSSFRHNQYKLTHIINADPRINHASELCTGYVSNNQHQLLNNNPPTVPSLLSSMNNLIIFFPFLTGHSPRKNRVWRSACGIFGSQHTEFNSRCFCQGWSALVRFAIDLLLGGFLKMMRHRRPTGEDPPLKNFNTLFLWHKAPIGECSIQCNPVGYAIWNWRMAILGPMQS